MIGRSQPDLTWYYKLDEKHPSWRNELDPPAGKGVPRGINTVLLKLFIGSINWSTTSQGLFDHFTKYGRLREAAVVYDLSGPRPRSRGYGFVTFYNLDDALAAVKVEHPMIDDRRCDVSLAAMGFYKKAGIQLASEDINQRGLAEYNRKKIRQVINARARLPTSRHKPRPRPMNLRQRPARPQTMPAKLTGDRTFFGGAYDPQEIEGATKKKQVPTPMRDVQLDRPLDLHFSESMMYPRSYTPKRHQGFENWARRRSGPDNSSDIVGMTRMLHIGTQQSEGAFQKVMKEGPAKTQVVSCARYFNNGPDPLTNEVLKPVGTITMG